MIVYRTDTRELEPGEEIISPGDHRDELPNEETVAAEDAIRAGQPNGERIRATSLYVYPNFELAKIDWTYRSKGKRHVYKLRIDATDIIHAGDLQTYNQVITDLRAARDPATNVAKYWKDEPSERYTEYLVRKAVVIERLKQASEWKTPMQRAVAKHRDDPRDTEFYESVLKNFDDDRL
ncbi:hypothetical protein ABIC09_004748 [Bradyrhizobium sp. S3.12.5]|uniref:hypothetical protein n=1 Tax=Bradyrhizobium sp. S3.12.5 TaxID=3156386 RepID=UPI003399F71C